MKKRKMEAHEWIGFEKKAKLFKRCLQQHGGHIKLLRRRSRSLWDFFKNQRKKVKHLEREIV